MHVGKILDIWGTREMHENINLEDISLPFTHVGISRGFPVATSWHIHDVQGTILECLVRNFTSSTDIN